MLANSHKFLRTAIIYLRSYSREKLNLYSLEEQEKVIRDYASQNGYRILKIFREDNVSAKTFNRPAFLEMLGYIKLNPWKIKFVIVMDMSRLSTDPSGSQRLIQFFRKNGIKMISLTQWMLKTPQKTTKMVS